MLAFKQAGLTPRVTQQTVQVRTVLSLVESAMAFHPGNENAALARFRETAHTALAQN